MTKSNLVTKIPAIITGNPVVAAGNPVVTGNPVVVVAGNPVGFLALKSKTVLHAVVNYRKAKTNTFYRQLGLHYDWCLSLKIIRSSFLTGTHCF